ncbi:hypothetical protein CSOJ01_11134 [Colletotrichum sojae]|uniref:Uncharacterized protein n=1 Tax=Colletotrichum sojae TaxID=2175907 RepID=A0A8H6MP94_9PEZI|nr:hypothetical protein CSOJ01_11134 [Colletotrichum sojae]
MRATSRREDVHLDRELGSCMHSTITFGAGTMCILRGTLGGRVAGEGARHLATLIATSLPSSLTLGKKTLSRAGRGSGAKARNVGRGGEAGEQVAQLAGMSMGGLDNFEVSVSRLKEARHPARHLLIHGCYGDIGESDSSGAVPGILSVK